ncbi:MAG: hypothetical protein A3E23_22660 [Burkholderiales bacterium RIFCSPHIGHO2_12_FULL_65_48]|nr:MAG: hypothetical protein A3C40_06940 [Burkholderiales bacterium RIFCSPHIGHO2_02_FULL_64_19]OGB23895.1 MAG: hypothetical protein A3E23_22660 [Burkholderiales bacterium RIFCSPHIGHO2_12_FULL_65_48]OGB57096.1 MAG: hypothetical protein A3F71_01360 [Burkholderiales bacterium RIFCSPLOWO2_12_FULL_64_33]
MPATTDSAAFVPFGIGGMSGGNFDYSRCAFTAGSACTIDPTVFANASSPAFATCTTTKLHVRNYTAVPTIPLTVTLYKNGASTGLSCTVGATPAATCTSTTAVALLPTDNIALQMSTTNVGGFTSGGSAIEGTAISAVHCE